MACPMENWCEQCGDCLDCYGEDHPCSMVDTTPPPVRSYLHARAVMRYRTPLLTDDASRARSGKDSRRAAR